jgi:hypothetical protein
MALLQRMRDAAIMVIATTFLLITIWIGGSVMLAFMLRVLP